MAVMIVPDRILPPTVEDLTISPSGEVRVRDGLEHPLTGEHIGRVSTTGAPVWITPDGQGGLAGSTGQAAGELLADALADYPTVSAAAWDRLMGDDQ